MSDLKHTLRDIGNNLKYNYNDWMRRNDNDFYSTKKLFRDTINDTKTPVNRVIGHVKGAAEDLGHNIKDVGTKIKNSANYINNRLANHFDEDPRLLHGIGIGTGLIGAGLAAKKFINSRKNKK